MSDTHGAHIPDGIADTHSNPPDCLRRHSSIWAFLLFGGVVAAGLAGVMGGVDGEPLALDATEASLVVTTRRVIRNGELFETRFLIEARAPIADAVLAISPSFWRDMTVNTMIPAAAEEKFENGAFAFSYGPLEAGERIEIKLDGQINPPLFAGTTGTVSLRDGKRVLAQAPLSIMVLP